MTEACWGGPERGGARQSAEAPAGMYLLFAGKRCFRAGLFCTARALRARAARAKRNRSKRGLGVSPSSSQLDGHWISRSVESIEIPMAFQWI